MYTHEGSVTDGASELALRMVEADPQRKLTALTSIALETVIDGSRVADEIAECIGEGLLYTRPLCSLLVNMGIIRKTSLKIASVCRRAAHVLEPTPDLIWELWQSEYENATEARAIIAAMIIKRMAETRRAERTNRGGARA